MAKVKLNPVLESIHGKVGDLVFRRVDEDEIVSKMPRPTGAEPTPSQAAQQERFRLAVLYGKAVLADPDARVVYEEAAARKGDPVFALAVGDFLNAPAIHEIDLSAYTGQIGETISIRASDDVEVQGVTVAIRNQIGTILEQGPATWTTTSGSWRYTTTSTVAQGQSISIEVSATDRPGHRSTRIQAKN